MHTFQNKDYVIPMTSNWNWYMGDFLESLFGHPWTIPKIILEITTSF
jgi:hypothetical protein